MISRLRGQLWEKRARAVLIDTGGVGYEIAVAPDMVAGLGPEGSECDLYIFEHLREDQHSLYGFGSRDDRDLFEKVVGISGVGPRGAFSIFGTLGARGLLDAVAREDADLLATVPGIGKKRARHIMLELRERLEVADLEHLAPGAAEAHAALLSLGYSQAEAAEALRGAPAGDAEEALRQALARLAGKTG